MVTRLQAEQLGLSCRQIQCWDLFSSLLRPDRRWGPLSFLSNEYRGILPGGKAVWVWIWPLTSIQCRVQEFVELYLHSPICLHGVVFC